MPRYFFDGRDGDCLVRDDEGVEFATIEEARAEAAAALVDWARDTVPRSARRELAIVVRDERDRELIKASLRFEAQML